MNGALIGHGHTICDEPEDQRTSAGLVASRYPDVPLRLSFQGLRREACCPVQRQVGDGRGFE